jgi:ribosome-associated protein
VQGTTGAEQSIFLYLALAMNALTINRMLTIPAGELRFRFTRSGGPGGQNVNKVETRVELQFDVRHSPSLTEEQRERILAGLSSRIDREGSLRVVSQESRSQHQNRLQAMEKFTELLRRALQPRKKRKATRVTRSAHERRQEKKKQRGEVKKLRRAID